MSCNNMYNVNEAKLVWLFFCWLIDLCLFYFNLTEINATDPLFFLKLLVQVILYGIDYKHLCHDLPPPNNL